MWILSLFGVALILIAILSGVGGLMTLLLLPAHPVLPADSETAHLPVLALKAE